ncbi:VOC family protein [Microbacterium sp. H1-D42]|uniref:VOC family protein n=1 Tax=Microbacterium sp. H1-D42 TaxID=2925844 RepID=UPI001F53152C|nr:VOC family protein [Microbacterium sp. H1-D42]UNK70649.1 VOC family protein [Microbacterium sp. H1-D42]
MSQKIIPNLWFNGDAEQGGEFYSAALPNTTSRITARYPDEVPESQAGFAGKPLVVDLSVDGFQITMINSDAHFRPNPSISFMLNFDPLMFGGDADTARARLDETWAALAEGGMVLMELAEYPFSPHYGWVQDRYGVSWQLMLTDPEGDPRPFVIPQIMFAGAVQDKAREAAELYTSLFDDAEIGMVAEYPAATGAAGAGSVMFGEFRVGDQWFSMMDSNVAHEFAFSPGVSLEVRCHGQAEIDRLWDALSAVPEAEQCGWLADRYGVSWQIVPDNMGELMERPGAYGRMLKMKKLVIADF